MKSFETNKANYGDAKTSYVTKAGGIPGAARPLPPREERMQAMMGEFYTPPLGPERGPSQANTYKVPFTDKAYKKVKKDN